MDPVPITALQEALRAAGFMAEEPEACWNGTPFANVLLVARRILPIDAERLCSERLNRDDAGSGISREAASREAAARA